MHCHDRYTLLVHELVSESNKNHLQHMPYLFIKPQTKFKINPSNKLKIFSTVLYSEKWLTKLKVDIRQHPKWLTMSAHLCKATHQIKLIHPLETEIIAVKIG